MNLSGKVAVITGASDGIGKQIAYKLAQQNVSLCLIARDETKLSALCDELQKFPITVKYYSWDVGSFTSLSSVVDAIAADFGTVDILINNAGIRQKLLPLEDISVDIIDEVIQTNLLGVIYSTKLFLPLLKSRDESAIFNVVSKSWILAQNLQSVYTASKYWVRWFTEVLRIDLKGSSVKVAALYQSGTNTKMFEKAGDDFSTAEFTDPSDLADLVVHMLSLPKKLWAYDIRVEK